MDKWNPPFSGTIDICIKANGDWYHEGVKFTRQPLAKLFASILKKEGNNYFLVTPTEKWKITVEDKPLLVIESDVEESSAVNPHQKIRFRTSTDDVFYLDDKHPIRMEKSDFNDDIRPYIPVRNNLDALINRNIFYRLAELAVDNKGTFGLWSCGHFFKLE